MYDIAGIDRFGWEMGISLKKFKLFWFKDQKGSKYK